MCIRLYVRKCFVPVTWMNSSLSTKGVTRRVLTFGALGTQDREAPLTVDNDIFRHFLIFSDSFFDATSTISGATSTNYDVTQTISDMTPRFYNPTVDCDILRLLTFVNCWGGGYTETGCLSCITCLLLFQISRNVCCNDSVTVCGGMSWS